MDNTPTSCIKTPTCEMIGHKTETQQETVGSARGDRKYKNPTKLATAITAPSRLAHRLDPKAVANRDPHQAASAHPANAGTKHLGKWLKGQTVAAASMPRQRRPPGRLSNPF